MQVFRINSTRGPFKNAKFRQAFNYLMDRAGHPARRLCGPRRSRGPALGAGEPGLRQVLQREIRLQHRQGEGAARGLRPVRRRDEQLEAPGERRRPARRRDQPGRAELARSAPASTIELDLKQGAEFTDALLGGRFDAVFGAIGNIQKFPTRVATNSIYRTANNPVLGTPHPHPEYVAAIERVNTTFGSGADVKAAYDNLNKVLVEAAFAIPTNTYDTGLIVAAKNVDGFTLDIDNMLVARTIGFKP